MRALTIAVTSSRVDCMDNHLRPVCRITSVGACTRPAEPRASIGSDKIRMNISCSMLSLINAAYLSASSYANPKEIRGRLSVNISQSSTIAISDCPRWVSAIKSVHLDAGFSRISRDIWSGCNAEYSIAGIAPNSIAITANRSNPRRPMTASRSRARATGEMSATSRSERPLPLGSKRTSVIPAATRRSNPARRIGCSQSSCTWLENGGWIQTSGGPLPAVVTAIVTASLVFTYCAGGGVVMRTSSRALDYRPHTHRLPHPLQRLLAPVLEAHARRRTRQRAHRLRYQHLTGSGEAADSRSDVDGAAVHVVPLADDVSCVKSEVEREISVVSGSAAGERRFDRLAGRGEDREDAIAERFRFDAGSAILSDHGSQGAVQFSRLRPKRGVAETLCECRRVRDIGEENGSHASIRAANGDRRAHDRKSFAIYRRQKFFDKLHALRVLVRSAGEV